VAPIFLLRLGRVGPRKHRLWIKARARTWLRSVVFIAGPAGLSPAPIRVEVAWGSNTCNALPVPGGRSNTLREAPSTWAAPGATARSTVAIFTAVPPGAAYLRIGAKERVSGSTRNPERRWRKAPSPRERSRRRFFRKAYTPGYPDSAGPDGEERWSILTPAGDQAAGPWLGKSAPRVRLGHEVELSRLAWMKLGRGDEGHPALREEALGCVSAAARGRPPSSYIGADRGKPPPFLATSPRTGPGP